MPERGERRARRALRLLLRLYPSSFREAVGDDLVETTLARRRDSVRGAGLVGGIGFWLTDGARFVLDALLERVHVLAGVRDDVRQAARQLRRAPAFHGLAIATIALGIGVTTAMFAVADAVVFRPLPYDHAGDLHVVHTDFGDIQFGSNSLPNLRDIRAEASGFVWLAGARGDSPAVTGLGEPVRASALVVTEDWLPRLGARPAYGRLFDPADFDAGAPRVAVVSRPASRRWWGGADALGRSIELDGVPHTVIGVMDDRYRDPEPVKSGARVAVWVPARADDPEHERSSYAFQVLGRLKPDVPASAAEKQLAAIGARLSEAYPESNSYRDDAMGFSLASLKEQTVGDARQRLLLLLGAASLLLLLACGNVANLFLARGTARAAELGVRSALGASRSRIARQLLVESLATATVGGVLGAALGAAVLRGFVALAPAEMPRLWETSFDLRTAAFVLLATALTGIAFGLLPALRARRDLTAGALRARAPTPSPSGLRAHTALVSVEVALALVLVAGSALLLRSFSHLVRVEPGFDAADAVVVDVRPPATVADADRRHAFYRELAQRLEAIPAVRGAALSNSVPWSSGWTFTRITPEDESASEHERRFFRFNPVTADWFDVLDVPVLRGRVFTEGEAAGGPPVAVVNEAAARAFFPGDESPVGRRLKRDSDDAMREVVAVVGDVRQRGPDAEPEPEVYLPYGPGSTLRRMQITLELDAGAAPPVAAIRAAVGEIAPDLPVDDITTMREHLARSTAEARFLTSLVTAFAALALLLAVVGTYATASYTVSRRMREMGIRVALGARPGSVFGRVVLRNAGAAGVGLLAGLGLTLALSRFLEAYVFGITAHDPGTVGLACALIGGAAVVASVGPAARAARVDPNEVLRAE